MKRYLALSLFIIILLGTFASATYSWTGRLDVGDTLYVNDLAIRIDKNRANNRTAAVVYHGNQLLGLIYAGNSKTLEGLEISVSEFNDYVILSISSESPFTISFNATEDYSEESKKLKKRMQS